MARILIPRDKGICTIRYCNTDECYYVGTTFDGKLKEVGYGDRESAFKVLQKRAGGPGAEDGGKVVEEVRGGVGALQ